MGAGMAQSMAWVRQPARLCLSRISYVSVLQYYKAESTAWLAVGGLTRRQLQKYPTQSLLLQGEWPPESDHHPFASAETVSFPGAVVGYYA